MPFEVSMSRVSHISHRAATVRLVRAASHLRQAGKHLTAASHAAPDRHLQKRLRRISADLNELSLPLASLVSSLERGGGQ